MRANLGTVSAVSKYLRRDSQVVKFDSCVGIGIRKIESFAGGCHSQTSLFRFEFRLQIAAAQFGIKQSRQGQ